MMTHTHLHVEPHEHHPHGGGIIATLASILHLPGYGHDHAHADLAADSALRDNNLGIRTVWLALLLLGITTVLQILIYVASGSVALLADTIHNLGDALNSVPLLVAFYLARRAATRRYTYGFGRAEDIAGVLIVVSIAFSAGYILLESFQKLVNPQPLTNLPWVAVAAVIGFLGNELVALMQIRVGRQIGSDALIADGQHARVDGLTSLAVLIAAFGTLIGLPILDPIVGVVIAVAIVGITWNAMRAVWYRLMDAVDPHLVEHMGAHLMEVDGVAAVESLRARWIGHRLYVETTLAVNPGLHIAESQVITEQVQAALRHVVAQLGEVTVQMRPSSSQPASRAPHPHSHG